jgi:hypothetical protein
MIKLTLSFRGVAGFLWLGGPDNRGAAGDENSRAEGTPRYPTTNFLIEFVQISGVHLIVPGGSGPPDPPASYAPALFQKTFQLLLRR